MKPTIHYAATYYLSIWLNSDHAITQALGYPRILDDRNLDNRKEMLRRIVTAATDYSVIRGFKINPAEERLEHLLDALHKSVKPFSDSEAIAEVNVLIDSLSSFYNKKLVSAASKFLWFRFKSPVVIYDSFAYDGLKKLDFVPDKKLSGEHAKWYPEYVGEWRNQYELHRIQICAVCDELIAFKKFTPAYAIEDSNFRDLVNNEWFRERVFDAYLMLLGVPASDVVTRWL